MEFTDLKTGLRGEAEEMVTAENTAEILGSGSLAVYATPAMICLIEKAAATLAQQHLPEGWTSVGISLQIKHQAPTPIGMKVRAEVEITEVEGRKITFTVRVLDGRDEVGCGVHERFIVDAKKFQSKANGKA